MKTIQNVVENNLCVSCGVCCFRDGKRVGTMVESTQKGIFEPSLDDESNDLIDICPGKGYPIVSMAKEMFKDVEYEDIELGRWKKAVVAHSTDEKILENASSGGVMTAIAKYLLEEKLVDGVITTKFAYGANGPRPKTFIATTWEKLVEAQGSKYIPVPVFEILDEVYAFDGRLLFIGTPCQIAALRLLQKKDPILNEKIYLTVGNFCGGYRDLKETDKIIRRSGFNKEKIKFFRYRGGGQPGSMLMIDSDNRKRELAYPGYARMTGVIKSLRCRLCVDATAELADFSCGDAWIPKYLKTNQAWSIIMARSNKAVEILKAMEISQALIQENISVKEIKKSQEGNLISKKVRQESRMKLYKLLGYSVPIFDGGYYKDRKGILFELKVYFSHSVFAFLEQLGLYKKFAILIKRYPKEKEC